MTLDNRLDQFKRELSGQIGNSLAIDPALKAFMTDLFREIQVAIRAERDKKASKDAILFWQEVEEAIGQKRRAIDL